MELNRRNFMKGAAVASAFLPRFNILHADDITIGPKDDTINVAMIGFGAEGKVLAASLVRIPGVRVRCVCDIWKFEQQRARAVRPDAAAPARNVDRIMLFQERSSVFGKESDRALLPRHAEHIIGEFALA